MAEGGNRRTKFLCEATVIESRSIFTKSIYYLIINGYKVDRNSFLVKCPLGSLANVYFKCMQIYVQSVSCCQSLLWLNFEHLSTCFNNSMRCLFIKKFMNRFQVVTCDSVIISSETQKLCPDQARGPIVDCSIMIQAIALLRSQVWDRSWPVIKRFLFCCGTAKIDYLRIWRVVRAYCEIRWFNVSVRDAVFMEEGDAIKYLGEEPRSNIE